MRSEVLSSENVGRLDLFPEWCAGFQLVIDTFFFGGLEGCRVHEGCDRYGPQIVLVGIDAVVDVYILDVQYSWGRTSHRTQWPHLTLIKDHIDDEKVTVWELRGADVNFNQEHVLCFLSMLPKCICFRQVTDPKVGLLKTLFYFYHYIIPTLHVIHQVVISIIHIISGLGTLFLLINLSTCWSWTS